MQLLAAVILWVSVSCIGFMENSVNVGFSHNVASLSFEPSGPGQSYGSWYRLSRSIL